KRRWISGIVTTVVMLSVFMLCFFAKSNQMECTNTELWQAYGGRFTVSSNIETGEQYDVSQIMDEFHASFASQNTAIMDNYYFLTKNNGQTYSTLQAAWFQLGNQLFYMFFIVLAIACVFYLLLGNNQKILPCMLALLGSMGVLFFGTNKENNTYFFVELLIMLGCSSLYYMYEAHYPAKEVPAEEILEEASVSPEEAETEDTRTEEEKEAELLRARALIFIGENEELYYEIKRQENPNGILKTPEYYMNRKAEESMSCEHEFVKKEVKFIENPLPLPKKHVAKTMEYGFEPDENMDFDYDIKEDDDFDI
ncbi:MAG TPA: hypothetical protein PLU43_01760, partial [Lachnospiraceae bacterium]|nr:hypothetical protein [Lachnospiraceae bacterium]